jgi:hypothetical protein
MQSPVYYACRIRWDTTAIELKGRILVFLKMALSKSTLQTLVYHLCHCSSAWRKTMTKVNSRKVNTSVRPMPKTTVTNLLECCFPLRFARQCIVRPRTLLPAALCTLNIDMELVLKLGFRPWQDVFISGDPHIDRGKQKDVDSKSANQPSDDDDGEGPL